MKPGNEPNKLINEKSPYLLQHAHNPVDWFPWGAEVSPLVIVPATGEVSVKEAHLSGHTSSKVG